MKKLFSNKGGEVSYGPKWKHTESSCDSENNNDHDQISVARVDNQHQFPIPKGKRVEVSVKEGELMYEAALKGDWLAAEVLLDRDPKLAHDYLTEEGDRALHVAAAMKHKEFVKKLVGRMREEELALLDGRGGYTACCYTAISGNVKIARLIIKNRPNLVTARDEENATPLRKAALRGNKKMLPFLLKDTKDEDLSREEWFDLLLLAICGNMFGLAIQIIGKNGSIATLANEEGTALHLLARVHKSRVEGSSNHLSWASFMFDVAAGNEDNKGEFRRLGEKLWDEMLKMEKASLVELNKKPVHIIHEAAKAGHVHIITMITRSIPKLLWETDSDGYTIFHLAVMYRQTAVFKLVHQVEAMFGFTSTWQDQQGNNILHLAAAAAKQYGVSQQKLSPTYQMQRELKFFKVVKKIVPPSCLMTRNEKRQTPEELFSKTHKKLLKESATWMTNRADSLMLIATILLTVVFAAAFTVPGGYDSKTGEPILAAKSLFKTFVIFDAVSVSCSVFSIIMFQSIMASSFAQEEFLLALPVLQELGFLSLLMSLAGAFVALIALISLFNIGMNAFMWVSFILLCQYTVIWAAREFGVIVLQTERNTLFDKNPIARKVKAFIAKVLR